MKDILMAEISGIRAQLVALEAHIDAVLLILTQEADAEICQHPPDKRLDLSTMGQTRWMCRECRHLEEVT